MDHHADPDPRHYRRSLARAALRALMALAIVGVAVAVASFVGRADPTGPVITPGAAELPALVVSAAHHAP